MMQRYIPRRIPYRRQGYLAAGSVGALGTAGYAVRGLYHAVRAANRTPRYPNYSLPGAIPVAPPYVPRRILGYRRKAKTFPKKIKSQIKELKRLAESDMGTHIHCIRLTSFTSAAHNAVTYSNWNSINIVNIELALAQLRYYNPEIPATLTQAVGATGSFQKEFYFKKIYTKMTVRNNYQIPIDVSVYACRVRDDTGIEPDTAVTNGLVDVGGPTGTSPLVYPTDSIQFTDLWRIEASKKVMLEPGTQCSLGVPTKSFQYDPSISDSHTEAFQTRFKGLSYLVRLTGCLGHDTVEAEFALNQSKADIYLDTTFEIQYAAGADIKFITIADSSASSFTTGGVVSNKPVADNQSFSIT